MASTGMISIEIVFGLADRQKLIALAVDPATTVEQAIVRSGIADVFPEQDIYSCSVGIWGREVQKTQSLQEGDRIEIYRPLSIDPRDARRQLAERGEVMGRDQFGNKDG